MAHCVCSVAKDGRRRRREDTHTHAHESGDIKSIWKWYSNVPLSLGCCASERKDPTTAPGCCCLCCVCALEALSLPSFLACFAATTTTTRTAKKAKEGDSPFRESGEREKKIHSVDWQYREMGLLLLASDPDYYGRRVGFFPLRWIHGEGGKEEEEERSRSRFPIPSKCYTTTTTTRAE